MSQIPKLNKQQQKQTENVESSSFGPLPEGRYRARLAKDVVVRDGREAPQWVFEFDSLVNLATGETAPGRQWMNVSTSEKAAWKMKEVFDAFGYALDSDTEEMVGEEVGLVISQRIIPTGKRQGETGNNIDRVFALSDEDAAGDGDAAW